MYEKIGKNIQNCDGSIKIGLPKGTLYEHSRRLVREITCSEVPKGRLSLQYGKYIFYFLKLRDIPKLIETKKLDCGITSDEWIAETRTDLARLVELDWCNTSIAVIVHKDCNNEIEHCITEYSNLAKLYFKNSTVKIDYISGSCEALVPSLYDCCIGCVESGDTLQQNDLKIEKIILHSRTVFVTRKEATIENFDEILKYIRRSGH